MKKNNSRGFMLAETLIVTAFVAGVLIFLFIQFSNLSKSYDESYIYNTTEGLYALEDIKNYIKEDTTFTLYLNNNIETMEYIDITDCSLFNNKDYCLNLFKLENINKIFITKNIVPKNKITNYTEEFLTFINKINKEGDEPYRLVASFNNSTYATLRIGDSNE